MFTTTPLRRCMALLLALWLALAPVTALAQAPGIEPAPVAVSSPLVGEPVITASDTVVKVGDPVTLALKNGPFLQEGNFRGQAAGLEFFCGGKWQAECPPLKIDRDGNASVQARIASGNVQTDVVFNFRKRNGDTVPAGVIVRFYPQSRPRPDPPPVAQPEFYETTIASKYPAGGFYLAKVDGDDLLSVCVKYKDQTGYAEWTVNDVKIQTSNDICPQLRINVGNLGRGITKPPDYGQYTYRVRASNPSGASKTLAITFVQVPYSAEWFRDVGWIQPPVLKGAGDSASYDLVVQLPLKGYQLDAPGFIAARREVKTSAGITFKGTLSFPVKCRENYDIAVRTEADAFFANVYLVEAKGKAGGGASAALRFRNCQILGAQLLGSVYAVGNADAQKEVKVLDVLLDLLLDPGWAREFIEWLADKIFEPRLAAGGVLDLHPGLQASIAVQPVSPYLSSKASFFGRLELSGRASTNIKVAELIVRADGKGLARFNKDGLDRVDNLLFEAEAAYRIQVQGRILAWWKEKTTDGRCKYPPYAPNESCRKQAGLAAAAIDENWRWITHPGAADYVVFRGGELPQAWAPPQLLPGQPVTSMLVSHIYTYTTNALAVNTATGQALAVWDHDDLAIAPGQSMELMASKWDGSTWSAPVPMTSDTFEDMAAQVAWAAGSQAVAVWHRLAEEQPVGGTPAITVTNQAEIAVASYDANTNTWSAPVLLTHNDVADFGVQLARNPNGALLAAWTATADGLVPGAPEQPGTIMAAFYTGTWGTPTPAVSNIAHLGEVAAGYGAGGATIAYTQRVTPTLAAAGALTPTHQVFVAHWDGARWSTPQQVTAGLVEHRNLSLLYNAQDQPLLVWLADGNLRLRNLATGAAAELALDPELGVVDALSAVQDAQGNVAAVLRGQGQQADLLASFYDQAHALWSAPQPLTIDDAVERLPAPAFDADGNLKLLYATTLQQEVETPVSLDDGTIVTLTMPADVRTDLVTLQYAPHRNVRVVDGSVVVGEAHPAPGVATLVSATVQNTGDWPLDNLVVRFYDGDPNAGGTLIADVPAAAVLAGGASAVVSTAFTPPQGGGICTLYAVVDAAQQVAESDETDNHSTVRAFGPDLAITEAYAAAESLNYAALNIVIASLGTSATPSTTVAFHAGVLTGTVQTTVDVPPLAVGERYTTTVVWGYDAAPAGNYPLVAAVNEHDFEELDMGDNLASLSYEVGPDLAMSPYDLETGDLTADTVPVTLNLANLGTVAATNATVSFYKDWSLDESVRLLTHTTPSLPPDSAVQITVLLPGPLACGVYVQADTQAGSDVNWANNLVVASGDVACNANLYLPAVKR